MGNILKQIDIITIPSMNSTLKNSMTRESHYKRHPAIPSAYSPAANNYAYVTPTSTPVVSQMYSNQFNSAIAPPMVQYTNAPQMFVQPVMFAVPVSQPMNSGFNVSMLPSTTETSENHETKMSENEKNELRES